MNFDLIRLPAMFLALCVAQVFILNHIQLFGCAMPLLYVYFVLSMKKDTPKWVVMVWAFALGIVLDIFANTPGVTAASMTAAGMAQPYLLNLFITREGEDAIVPSVSTMGSKQFVKYTVALVLLYCVVFFTLDILSFFNGSKWFGCVLGSTILTVILILALDRLIHRKIGN